MTEPALISSSRKGMYAVAKVQMRAHELSEAGTLVELSIPINPDSRYDMVVDTCGKLYRAQIKYAGGISTRSVGVAAVRLTKGDHNEKKYTSDEIDVLLVYIPAVDKICWFGPEFFHNRTGLLIRYAPSKNNQIKNCIMLEDYVW